MVTGDLFLAQAQKSCGVVIEDIALLRLRQEWRLFDRLDGWLDDARPDHLVGAKHDAVTVTRFDDLLQIPIEGGPRFGVHDARDIDIDLRVCEQQSAQIGNEWISGVHDVDTQTRMPHEHFLQSQRAAIARSISRVTAIWISRSTRAKVNSNGNV